MAAAAATHAVVVGAGPAGALAALLLAGQGFRVSVFEKRLPERLAGAAGGSGAAQQLQGAAAAMQMGSSTIGLRSYNVVLSERALQALDGVGVKLPKDVAPHCHAALNHKVRGEPHEAAVRRRAGRDVTVNRGVLASILVQKCIERFPDTITFHFGYEISGLGAAAGTARFRPAGGAGAGSGGDEELAVSFNLLVGADGANSGTRQLLQREDAELQVEQKPNSKEYKACTMGAVDQFLPVGVAEGAGTVHAWSGGSDKQIIGSASSDGQLLAVLILDRGEHDRLGSAASYEAFLLEAFPSIPPLNAHAMALQLAAAKPSVGGISTRCSKLASGRVVLVGDAAHSVWPTLGHGANSALESAALLAAALKSTGGAAAPQAQLEAALAAYSAQRLPDGHAVVELSELGFGSRLLFPQLLAQLTLHRLLPRLVPSPAFLLLHSTALPYSQLQRRMLRETLVFKAALVAGAGLAAVGLASLFWARR